MPQGGELIQRTLGDERQGGGSGDCVREDPVGHAARESQEQHHTTDNGRVGEVLAQAAEKLLDHDDGHQAAKDRLPQGNGDRQVHGQDQTGDGCGAVADGDGLFGALLIQKLKQNTGSDTYGADQQGASAKDDTRRNEGGTECDQNISHNGLRGSGGANMGRDADIQFTHW